MLILERNSKRILINDATRIIKDAKTLCRSINHYGYIAILVFPPVYKQYMISPNWWSQQPPVSHLSRTSNNILRLGPRSQMRCRCHHSRVYLQHG